MDLDPALARLIIEHLGGVAVTDSQGRYIYVSETWAKELGIRPQDVLGKYVKDVFPSTKIDMVLQTGIPALGEVFYSSNTQKKPKGVMSYVPILKNGELVAGLIFTIFKDLDVAMGFKPKLDRLYSELDYFKKELRDIRGSRYTVDNIIGNSKALSQLREHILQAARSNSTVLIEGETGTGKELVAHAIHHASRRNPFNFIKVNCAAIPGDLLEAEFFGYEEGSFTGARKGGRQGKFEMANSGTLFLDEVNHMPAILQPKLLRVLQEKEIERIGGNENIPVDVRIIAASSIPLETLVRENRFRSDLFYRLNVIRITVPPLRERSEDIPILVAELIKRLNLQLGMKVESVAAGVCELLMSYDWPGNVRELQNVLERAMNIAWCGVLEADHFKWFSEHNAMAATGPAGMAEGRRSLKDKKRSTEKEAIMEALRTCHGNKTQAARLLNVSRTLLYKKMRQHDM